MQVCLSVAVDMENGFVSELPAPHLAVHVADDPLLRQREISVLQARAEVVQPPGTAAPAAPPQPCIET